MNRVAYVVFDGAVPQHVASVASMAHEHINDAIQEHDIEGASGWVVSEMVDAEWKRRALSAEKLLKEMTQPEKPSTSDLPASRVNGYGRIS